MGGNRIWILNGACAVVLAWGTYALSQNWTAFSASHQVALIENQPDRTVVQPPMTPVSSDAGADNWTDILARNPFSFDRNDINLEPPPPVAAIATGPKPIALGTIILGGERTAMLGKPGTRKGTPVKAGETFEGWKVVEIRDKTVVVALNGAQESLEVGRVPIERDYSKTSSTTPQTPASNSVAGAVASPSAAPARNSAAPPASPAAVPAAPPGTRVVVTPFGIKLEQEQ
jgi:hypothetical protein